MIKYSCKKNVKDYPVLDIADERYPGLGEALAININDLTDAVKRVKEVKKGEVKEVTFGSQAAYIICNAKSERIPDGPLAQIYQWEGEAVEVPIDELLILMEDWCEYQIANQKDNLG